MPEIRTGPGVVSLVMTRYVGLFALAGVLAFSSTPEASASIRTFKFRPDTLVVAAGTQVTWTNMDEIEHTVTADSAALKIDGALAGKGATFRAAFPKAGSYAYHCDRHQFMHGVVRVTSPGART